MPSSVGDVFKSRDKPFNDALMLLQQDNNKSQVIALCGMGGVGKTTMMEQLKADKNVTNLFNFIVKVAIGRDLNMLSIQNDIALCLGGEGLPEAIETSRADSLRRRFEEILKDDKKKILVILDDVWEKVKLQDIGLTIPLPKGVKLLLTSRDSNICKQIAADARLTLHEVRVDVLDEAEAKSFFVQITNVLEDDRNRYEIGCDIVKKCGCLPLAIKLIASTLTFQEDYAWNDTLIRLNNNDLNDNVKEIIKISYENIKDEDKDIFLLCGLFPEDANIQIEYLMRDAWGLKLLKKVSTLKEARQRTYTCVRKLINVNLLINSDHVGCVKMHDIVLAFVLGEVSKENHACIINHGNVSKWDEDEIGEFCKRISLTCRGLKHFPRDFKYPNLSLLQLMHGDMSFKFPEDFYENMKNLKVISYYKMQYPLLPRSLECSTNLKTLCLHECGVIFDDCSFIEDLVNLEVLSFAHCGIRKLPSTIANLRRLKLLDLTGCVDLQIDDCVFKKLENLEELYMRVSKEKAVRFTNANFEELKMLSSQLCALEIEFVEKNTWPENFSFGKLDKFKISIGCLLEKEEFKEKYSSRKTLKLVTECSSHLLACKFDELFTKTENLYLQVNDMIALEDVIHPYDQLSFCSLIDLEISNCVNLKYLFPLSVARGLKNLERLKISSCFVLEALVHNDGSVINGACDMIKFEKLMFLSLKNLPKLVCLFLVDNVVELPQLVELRVEELSNVTSIYPDKNNSSALLNSQVKISELKKLTIMYMDNLKQIWDATSEVDVNNISTLREIWVQRCNSLVNLFPTNPMGLLNYLESLTIVSCGSLEVIFNIDLECVGQVELVTNNRLRTIQLLFADKVRELWRIKGGKNYSSFIYAFEAIEWISISSCKSFRNIFTPTDSNSRIELRALTRISIRYDDTMYRLTKVLSREERDDSIFTVAFPSYLTRSFQNLQELSMARYDSVQAVFEMESSQSGRELVTTTNNQQSLLPNLQNLELMDMHSIDHVWKCSNWKKITSLQNQSSFQNLTTIKIWGCDKIKYVFSPLMAELLSNLKKIDIAWCRGMEEVVSNRDDKDEDESTSSTIHTTTTFFHHLNSLSVRNMRILKRIGGAGAGAGAGAKSSTGVTYDQIESSHVTTIVPWSLCQYPREILIDQCESLMEVFETEGINNSGGGGITSTSVDERNNGTHNISLAIPRPENINVPRLVNLNKLVITSCKLLKHVFTFSTLKSLTQLEELFINKCKAMEVIVKKENEEQINVVDFPRLMSLELENLPKLEGFFLGKNDFQWPSLEKVKIGYCPKMKVFTSGRSAAKKLEYMHTSLGKHSLEEGLNFDVTKLHQTRLASSESTGMCSDTLECLPWSFHNLIDICIKNNYDVKKIIPSNELLQLQKLEKIQLKSCYYVEEVFGEPQSVVEIPNLTQLELKRLESLKYIWKSNHHVKTVLLFPKLTTLAIDDCKSLKHVLTSSMVDSLQQLQRLILCDCPEMEVIVKIEESEFEGDAKVKEIALPRLTHVILGNLKSLKGFCLGKDNFSWPSLQTFGIIECPELTVFTKGHVATPALNVIDTSFGRCYLKEEEDINSFIKTKQQEGFQF